MRTTRHNASPAPTHTGSSTRARMNLNHFGTRARRLDSDFGIQQKAIALESAGVKPDTPAHDERRSAAHFPRHRRVAGRPFHPAQRPAQPAVFSMRAGVAADARSGKTG